METGKCLKEVIMAGCFRMDDLNSKIEEALNLGIQL